MKKILVTRNLLAENEKRILDLFNATLNKEDKVLSSDDVISLLFLLLSVNEDLIYLLIQASSKIVFISGRFSGFLFNIAEKFIILII